MKKYRPKNQNFEKMQNFRPSPNRSGTSLRGPGEFFECPCTPTALGTSAFSRIFHTFFPAAPEKKCEKSGKTHQGRGAVFPRREASGPARFQFLVGPAPQGRAHQKLKTRTDARRSHWVRVRFPGFFTLFSGSAGKKM